MYLLSDCDNGTHVSYPTLGNGRYIVSRDLSESCWRDIFIKKKHVSCLYYLFDILGPMSRKKYYGISSDYLKLFSDVTSIDNVQVTISLGTAGPHNKSVVLLAQNNVPKAIVKIAESRAAKLLLLNESRILKDLKNESIIVPNLIEVVGKFDAAFLFTDVIIEKKTGPDQSLVINYMRNINSIGREKLKFGNSQIYKNIHNNYETISQSMDRNVHSRVKYVLRFLEDFSEVAFYYALAHRDFTHWNLKYSSEGFLVAFDWEYASYGYPLLYDFFHYALMPRLVRKAVQINELMSVLNSAYQTELNDDNLPFADTKFQLLCYLIDVLLHYLFSRSGKIVKGDNVCRNINALLKTDWLLST